jgi:hypothetical protein
MRWLAYLSLAIFLAACGADQTELKSSANQDSQNAANIEQAPVETSPDLSASGGATNPQDMTAPDQAINVEGMSVEKTGGQPASSEQGDIDADQQSGMNQETNKMEIVKQPNDKSDSKS